MNDDVLGLVGKSVPNLLGVVHFGERTGRTYRDALTAGNAGHFVELQLKCTADMRLEAAFVGTDDGNSLILVTDGNAAAAKHALVVVADEVGHGGVLFVMNGGTFIFVFVLYTVVGAQLLKFAFAVLCAGETFFIVVGEKKLQRQLSGF